MNMEITLITSNPAKAEHTARHLGLPVKHQDLSIVEIQSLDLKEVAQYKVFEAYRQIGKPVLVDDTSLQFNATGKLPGPLIKWFWEQLGNDGLCKLLNAYGDRSAVAAVCFVFYDGKTLKFFEAEKRGTIATKPMGNNGFGWDPIFIPQGSIKTWGEMTTDEQNATSMRRVALKKFADYLKAL